MIQQQAQSRRASLPGVIRALWSYRRLVWSLVRRDLQQRATGAVWGHAWLVIQPAIQIVIYTVIFGVVLGARLPGVDDHVAYGLFLCAGIINWNHFSELVTRGQSMFLAQANLVKSLRVPRSILPVALTLSSLIHYAIIVGIFFLALLFLGRWPGGVLLDAIPLLALQSILGIALGVLSGTVNVFFRDIGQATPAIMQVWFWLTPIVYPVSILPEWVRGILTWNPIYATTLGYQRIVIEHQPPVWNDLIYMTAVAVAMALVAWAAFRSLSSDIVDEL